MNCSTHLNLLYSCCTFLYSWTSAIMRGHLECIEKKTRLLIITIIIIIIKL